MAYAVVKYRVLDIQVLARKGARYLLVQRGFLFTQLAICIGLTWGFLALLGGARDYRPAAMYGAVLFGSVLVVLGERIHRKVARRIDRAFFRSAYDARQVLETLALQTRNASSRVQLAELLAGELASAISPLGTGIYFATRNSVLSLVHGNCEPSTIAKDTALNAATTARPDDSTKTIAFVSPQLSPECLIPILAENGAVQGLVALGPKLSEEPYSREDIRLLRAVAVQAGIALESIHRAEQIADHLEAERRANSELDLARQVQSRLFPQRQPELRSLEYFGTCRQARQVGGDYYDYLDLGHNRVGFVWADISGKGMAAALLMANLQATLRGQYAVALEDLPGFLTSVNRSLYANTAENKYATLFYADYDDATRVLRYVNCGHPAPILMKSDGSMELLESECSVVGLFPDLLIVVRSRVLSSGDSLFIYSDGLSEAQHPDGEEFGEERLVEAAKATADQPLQTSLEAIFRLIMDFSAGEQFDDMTAILAKCG